MTERVRPLSSVIQDWTSKSQREREDWLLWGLHRLSVSNAHPTRSNISQCYVQVALSFVNDSCSSTHGNLRVDSIFISPSGEWKLGGFEVLSSPKDESAVLYVRSYYLSVDGTNSMSMHTFVSDIGHARTRLSCDSVA